MMKSLICSILLLLTSIEAGAQSLYCDSGILRWELDLCGALNDDGYAVDFGIAYYLTQYVGAKMQTGIANEFGEGLRYIPDDEGGFKKHYSPLRLKFTGSLVLRTPRILYWRRQDLDFYLFAEPGVVLSPGSDGSKDAKWACWNLRTELNIQVDKIIAYIGYGISDFCLFSGNMVHNWHNSNTDVTQSLFVGIGYKF